MNESVVLPEPISRNVFEQYLNLIEKIRLEVSGSKTFDEQQKLSVDIDFCDRLLNGIERALQDLNSEKESENANQITNAIQETLNTWILILASWEKNERIIDALCYNFIVILNIVQNATRLDWIDIVRYSQKLSSHIELSSVFESPSSSEFEFVIRNRIAHSVLEGNKLNVGVLEKLINDISESTNLNYKKIDPLNFSDELKESIALIARDAIKRYSSDYFCILNYFDELKGYENIEDLRQKIETFSFTDAIERLFQFDDRIENAIWDVKIKVSNETDIYNAAEIGYLLWTFSKAIESIEDIEVELISWTDGSKLANLIIRIKNLGSKVDLTEVLKKSQQAVEVAITKKPIEEIQKFEAEENKLVVEAEKLEKETKNLMDEKTAKISHELSIQNQILDLQIKQAEIEDKKVETLNKKLDAITKISELIKDGIIQNNSNVQIMINNILFIEKSKDEIKHDDIRLLDMNERLEKKSDA